MAAAPAPTAEDLPPTIDQQLAVEVGPPPAVNAEELPDAGPIAVLPPQTRATPPSPTRAAPAPTPRAVQPPPVIRPLERQAPLTSTPAPAPIPAPVPRIAEQDVVRPSFNCRYARSRSERMVCSDDRLAAADRRLARAFDRAVAAGVPRRELRADQDDWLAIREDAARYGRGAVSNIYEQRIQELEDMAGG